jgi:hypothetical protein
MSAVVASFTGNRNDPVWIPWLDGVKATHLIALVAIDAEIRVDDCLW